MELPRLARALAVLLGFAGIASAYPIPVDFGGQLLRWPVTRETPRVTYEVSGPSSTSILFLTDLVREAAALWNGVEASYLNLELAQGGEAAAISISFASDAGEDTLAAGYSLFDEVDEDGKPVHCEIAIYLSVHPSVEALAKTTLHELGHCVGLGHSTFPQAIMSYELDRNRFALDTNDEAALASLYPADGSKPALPPGCSVLAGRHPGSSAEALWWLLPILAILVL